MFFKNKKVLIIGGTGTIAQMLLKHIVVDSPKVIRLLSRDEYKQFMLQHEYGNKKDIQFLVGDVRNYESLLSAMEDIDYVFHLAAMKHVPACEYNPYEAVLTNIIGTNNVIKAAKAQNVEKVVFTSSDKAIYPMNNYGATKLVAERLISATSIGYGRTKFSSVRFGNVIGSRGSVIPLFVKQILENRRVTVTDESMSRFMMIPSQAAELTIKALKESKGGETFVLKMPVIILKDLVSVVIEESCNKYNIDTKEIGIELIGLRPGEKMYEVLMTYEESLITLEYSDMFIIPSPFSGNHVYTNAQKTNLVYSSHSQTPISREEIRKLILTEKLI